VPPRGSNTTELRGTGMPQLLFRARELFPRSGKTSLPRFDKRRPPKRVEGSSMSGFISRVQPALPPVATQSAPLAATSLPKTDGTARKRDRSRASGGPEADPTGETNSRRSGEPYADAQTPTFLGIPRDRVAAGDLVSGSVAGSAIASGSIPQSDLPFTASTVTSVTAGTGLSGGTITTSGTISNTGVLSMGAFAPLSSSGGQNPTVSLTGTVAVTNGGTGASTAAAARSNLAAAASGINADITSLSGISGNIALPESTSPTAGNILKGGAVLIHDFPGTATSYNTFVGKKAV
jgi:hypothetical protein